MIDAVLDVAPGMVIVDEAYAEFARPGTPSALELLPGHPRLVVTRTMSKAFGFAGGRLGYLAADPAVVDAVQLVRLPYHLSALTQAAARAAVAHREALLRTVDAIKEQRDRIVVELRDRGVEAADSDANFVLFEVGGDQRVAWQRLLDHGVLVRDVGLAGWLRVTAGTEEETDRVPGEAQLGGVVTRAARVERVTNETKVLVEIDLDGTGQAQLSTGVGFYDHMLNQLAKHGGFDLTVRTEGDLEIDAHHTMEDTAIALGDAFARALGDKAGIRRYGSATIPMDEVLCRAAVDLSGRPYVVHDEPELGPVHRAGLPDQHDPAHLRVVRVRRPADPARQRAAGGPRRRPAGRPPRGRGPVQGVLPSAAGSGRDRPAQRRRPAVDQGCPVMAIVLFVIAGILVGGVVSLVQQGATKFSVGVVAVLAALATAGGIAWLV